MRLKWKDKKKIEFRTISLTIAGVTEAKTMPIKAELKIKN